ncbi:AsnC family transcriptional regulator [Nocardiopsis sp. CNT-189]|uniref:Lrp/AsnC family transcriptional regulator n=1 Tax=Nocardiopsis oceanisediminis TaxID=2816862 RepID=UPI003B3417F3
MDELDLSLVGALQRDPRAPWSALAGPLGVDAATLSRRWARLSSSGEAWVTCYPGGAADGGPASAMVEVECEASRAAEVAGVLARDPRAATVEVLAGRADLLLTVFSADLRELTRYVEQRVARVPGVLRTRTDPLLHVVREGSRWRLGTLDAGQRQAIGERSASGRGSARDRPRDRELMLALGEDGRMPHAELSERTGIPVTTVRRRVAELLDSGRAVLRCDASARLTGWPETALLRLDVPAEELEEAAHGLGLLPQARLCALTAGPANLLLVVVARRLVDLPRIEALATRGRPRVRVVDRQLTLRTVKLMGRLLDEDGLARTRVPMDPWAAPPG